MDTHSTTPPATTRPSRRRPAAGSRGGGELVLERYRLTRRLGSGGFGVVWLARDEQLDRAVAVKRIAVDDPAVAARAEREAIAAARLGHPGIVALYEAGRDKEAVYLVSELVRGRTLAQLEAEGALSDRAACEIGMVLCDALAHAHARGVIHRDVKPGNVIVPDRPEDGGGIAKLTDFGVAQLLGDDALTRTGDVVGTLAYMAPEQAEGRAVTEAADLYSLGLVLFEALSGVNPVRGRTPASTVRRVGVRLPPLGRLRRDLPARLVRAIDTAVAPRPEQRGTLEDLRASLHGAAVLVGEETGTIAPARAEELVHVVEAGRDRVRTAPIRLGGRATAALGAFVLVALALWLLGPPPPLPALAGGAAAALVVAVLPRLGWIAAAGALVGWLLAEPEAHGHGPATPLAHAAHGHLGFGGLALLVLVVSVPTIVLLWRSGAAWWSAPALAPLLGLLTLAGAWPALAGQARHWTHRAALGGLGAWWLLMAEPLTGARLVFGAPPDALAPPAWSFSAHEALVHAVWPVLSSGALVLVALWALAAVALPLLVRGRSAALDLIAAGGWAAALAAATQAIASVLPWAGTPPHARGLVGGAVAAGVLAVAAQAARVEL